MKIVQLKNETVLSTMCWYGHESISSANHLQYYLRTPPRILKPIFSVIISSTRSNCPSIRWGISSLTAGFNTSPFATTLTKTKQTTSTVRSCKKGYLTPHIAKLTQEEVHTCWTYKIAQGSLMGFKNLADTIIRLWGTGLAWESRSRNRKTHVEKSVHSMPFREENINDVNQLDFMLHL